MLKPRGWGAMLIPPLPTSPVACLLKVLRIYPLLSSLANGLANPFVGFFAASSGVGSFFLSLVSSASTALPGISQILVFFARAGRDPRALVFYGGSASGSLWILAGIFSSYGQAFSSIYLATQAAAGIASLGWTLVLESVSRGRRGFELARYTQYANIGSLLATVLTGYVVGRRLEYMGVFFVASGVLNIASAILFKSYSQPVDSSPAAAPLGGGILGSPRMRRFMAVNFSYMVVMSFAWPLFPLAQVYKFRMSAYEVGILTIIAGVSTVLLQRIVGELVDWNRKLVMLLGRLSLASFPLGYALLDNVYQLYAVQAISGFANSAGIAYTSYVMDNSSNVRAALSLYNLLMGLATVAGSLIGGMAFSLLASSEDPASSVSTLMLLVGILRICLSLPYLAIEDPYRASKRTGGGRS